ncbi:MAG: hypothetical protein RLZZ301_916 [Bacteroidota bacterium]|jgi:gliding motility-associated-like protein
MRIIALLGLLLTLVFSTNAQYCTTATSTTAITPSSTVQSTASYPAGTAPVFTFTGNAGCTYTFTTCGLSSVDTYLRIYNSSVSLIQGWDDQCGLQTNAVWTCPATASYSIQLSQYVCGPLLGAATMSYSMSCPVPPCTNPVVNAGNDVIICAGATGQLSGTVTAGTGSSGSGGTMVVTISGSGWLDMVSWTLTNAAGSTVGSGGPYAFGSSNTVTIATPGTGPYSFYLETQGSICDNTANYTVTCNGTSVASGSVGPCLSTTVSVASCTGTTSTTPITYSWSPATNLSSTSILNPTANPSTTTTYTLTATQGTCTSTDQVTVYVNPLPTVNAGPDVSLCGTQASTVLNGTASASGGFTGPITVNVLSGSNLDETTWTLTNAVGTVIGSGGPYANASNNTVTISNPSNPPYTFYIETQGASNSNVAGYNVMCGSTSIIGGMAILTGGQTASVSVAGCAGTVTPTVSWSPSATLSSSTSLTPTASPTTTTTYTLTATANGCTNQDQVVVTIAAPPTVSVNSTTICGGQTATLTATPSTPGGTYSWTPGAQTSSSISVSPSSTTSYSVSYTLNGCTSLAATGTVSVTQSPTVSVPAVTFCPGSSATLTASGSPSGGTYTWSPGGQTTNSITVTPSATTNYTVTYAVPGCPSGTTTATATLANTLDWANIQFPGTTTICQGQNLTIYGQVYEAGLTNPSGQAAGITVEYAYSTTNTNPSTWPAASWSSATYNPLMSINPNNDEYSGVLSGLAVGTYYYAFRYTYNGCVVYGGYNATGGGFWNGTTNVNGVVTVAPLVTPTFNPVSAICSGATLAALPSTSLNGISGTWSPALSNTTTTTYTFTPSVGQCATTASLTITVNALPSPSISNASNTTVLTCTQTSISLTASGGTNYSWSNGTSTIGSAASLNVTSPGVYTVTATNAAGCTATSSLTITQNTTTPTPSISAPATLLTCTTSSIQLTASGGGTYSWSNGSAVVGSAASLSVSAPGTYTVTVTGSNGCTATASTTITQNITLPSAVITSQQNTTVIDCNNSTINLDASGATSYSWTLAGNTIGTSAGIAVTSPGTYIVTATGANGCTTTQQVTITQNTTLPVPVITSSNGNTITCLIPSITLTGSGGASYEWAANGQVIGSAASLVITTGNTYDLQVTSSNGCVSTSSIVIGEDLTVPTAAISSNSLSNQLTCLSTSIQLNATGGGTYQWASGATSLGTASTLTVTTPGTYQVTVTAANGCTATSAVTISQSIGLPVASIQTPSTTILTCTTTSIALTATGGGTYSWSNGSTVVGTNAVLNATSPGTYTVTVTGTNGCTNTASLSISQNITVPTATITNSSNSTVLTCAQSSINLVASGGTSYAWSNGTTNVGSSANLSVTSPGTYTVTVTGTNGCTATAALTITQTTVAPTASISSPSNVTELTCSLTSIALTASGGVSYSWSNGTSVVGTAAALTVSSPGTYTVTVTGANGCTATATSIITQNISAPSAAINSAPNTTMLSCSNTAISLTASGGVSYAWASGTTNLGTNATISVNTAATYTVTVTGANGCTATASTTITQNNQAPLVSIQSVPSTVLTCSTSSITLTGSSSTGSGTATWLNGVTSISTGPLSSTSSITITSPGTYILNILEANGCTGTSSVTITQNISAPTAGITNNTSSTVLTCSQNTISLTATGGASYSWSNGSTTVGTSANYSATAPGTYTVTVTGSNGCTATAASTLTQNTSAPSAGITNNTNATVLTCTLTSISLTATGGGTYSWSNGTTVLGTSANLTVTSPGTYTVTVTNSTNGCTATSSVIVTQNNAAPSVNLSTAPTTTTLNCTNTSIALTATGGGSYSWVSGSTNLGSQATINVTTPGAYTVTVTGSNGCTASATSTITQNTTAPTAAINSSSTVLTCSTTAIALTASGGTAYSWSNGTSTIGNAAVLNVTSPGTYTVTVTGANGCSATASTTISQNIAVPTATITNTTAATILTCSLTSISLSGGGGASYSWSNGTTNVGSSANLNVTAPGTYTLTATGTNGCTDTEVITVTQNIAAPTASITSFANTTVLDCNVSIITLGYSTAGVVNATWSNGTSTITSNNNINVSTPGTYTLTVTAANGCTATASVTITSQSNANPTFTQIAPICTGGTFSLPTTSTNAISGTWSPAPNFTSTTTYTFTPTAGVCANTTTMTVTVHPYPVISAQNDTICNGSTGTLTTQVNLAGGSYVWSPISGSLATFSASPSNTTSYNVIYTLAGCADTATAQIVVNPVPTIQVQNSTICAGQSGQLIANASLPNGVFSWANGSSNDTLTLSPAASTTQNVTYTLNGCTSPIAAGTITVNPVPSISMNNQTICAGNPVTMLATATPAGIYYWGPAGTQGIASNTFTPAQDSTISVFNILNGCSSDTIQATVTVNPLPVSTFTASVSQGCVPLTVSLTADDQTNNSYSWQTSDLMSGTGAQVTLAFQNAGSFDVTLTSTLNGCTSTSTIAGLVQVDNYPVAAFEPSSQLFTEPNQVISFWNYSSGAATYLWDFGDGSTATSEAPDHQFGSNEEGSLITLTAISTIGCTDTASYFIDYDPGLVYYIPNTFTPDGDNYNQQFVPIFTSGIDPYHYQLLIFDRWGEVVFESLNPTVGWDGTYGMNGIQCQTGTYTYQITIKLPAIDERKYIRGHVNLIR